MQKHRVPTEAISRMRLEEWLPILDETHSTPMLMVSVGHDDESGTLHILIPEDFPQEDAAAILAAALSSLTERPAERPEIIDPRH